MRPRAHRGREQQPTPQPDPQAEPRPETPAEAPKPPSAEGFEPITDPEPEQPPAQDPPPEPEQPADPAPAETVEGSEPAPAATSEAGEKMQGRLSELQSKLRDLLDYDQIAEVRLALGTRETDLEKHIKKANELGVREEDARRRLRLIRSSDTRFGLLSIFAAEEATYTERTLDMFYDQERPDGRPAAKPDPEPTDAQVNDAVHAHVADLDQQEADAAALAQETGTAIDGAADQPNAEGWDEGAPAVTPEGAERVAQVAGVSA